VLVLARLLTAIVLAVSLVAACRPAPPATRYPLRGKVIEVQVADRQVTIAHDEIAGFMPAMTMPFVVRESEAALLPHVAPGDEVTATLVVPDSRYWLENLVVVKKGEPDPGRAPSPAVREPQAGDVLPDVALVNQDGKTIRLSDYRGKALALTFIFTRCPLPDFCPLLMKNFAEAHAALVADERLRGRTHLLTVSFDTRHDTPAVLRAYGKPFQRTAPPFSHWELASGTEVAIRRIGDALDIEYIEESRTFSHNLRTAVVDPEGRLFRFYRGNDWTPARLFADLEAASARAGSSGQRTGSSR